MGIVLVLDSRQKPRGYGYSGDPEKEFKDEVQSNASPTAELLKPTFTDFKGNRVALADYRGKQNVVLELAPGKPMIGPVRTLCRSRRCMIVNCPNGVMFPKKVS